VGISGVCGVAYGGASAAHAVLWQNGTVTDLGNLGGNVFNTPAAINNNGQVTGWSDLPGDAVFHAFVWNGSGAIRDIGALPGDTYTLAYAINNQGQVVGQSLDANFNSRAFIYQNGQMTDLNTLAPPGSPFLIFANDINDSGQIVGAAFDSTSNRVVGFRAYPLYESGTSATAAKRTAAKVALPQRVRMYLKQRGLFGRMDRFMK
jgi:probable HAF family extracellular repeat protein